MNKMTVYPIVMGLSVALYGAAAMAQVSETKEVIWSIEAQELRTALMTWAQQSGWEIASSDDLISGVAARAVHGALTARGALEELLRGTDLTYEIIGDYSIAIRKGAQGRSSPASLLTTMGENVDTRRVRLASADPGSGVPVRNGAATRAAEDERETQSPKVTELDEIVVTGTHIKGIEPVVPVQTYTREDFEKTGAATAEDFMETLTQSFGGSQSADSSGDGLEGVFDPSMGASVNLRGLGSASTLVLVNGRRMAAAGRADFSDISMIPLSAVERIEVMTDGAAALYGSDAVGGVVNFIMRKDFTGAETRLRYGDTTEGGLAQRQVSQVAGVNWESGSVVASYEYIKQDALDRYDRDFSANATGSRVGPKALIPAEERHVTSVFARQDITDRVSVNANGSYAQRDGERWDWQSNVVQPLEVEREQFGGGAGVEVELGGSWSAKLDGAYDKGKTWRKVTSNPLTGASTVSDLTSDLWSADLLVSGNLISLPWGAATLAAGAGYREESYESKGYRNGVLANTPTSLEMDIKSTYAELAIPIGEKGNLPRAPLMISLAARHEDYSTFGTTTDPRYSVRWTPLESLSLYASFGTSFKAPNIVQFDESTGTNSNVINTSFRAPNGLRAMTISGNSNDLTEQTADTFTAGLELDLPVAEGLNARLNYFDIDYSDRIQSLSQSSQVTLTNPAYRSLVTLRGDIPDAEFDALVAEYLSGQDARVVSCTVPLSPAGACATSPSEFGAIIDHKLQNFASVEVSGLDLNLTQNLALGEDRLVLSLAASYFLKYDQQLNPGAAVDDILNRVYQPVDLRLRGGVSWAHRNWNTSLSVAHTAGYSTEGARFRTDSATPMPVESVDAWTTFTLAVGYSAPWLDGLSISLNVDNLFNEDPPFVDDQYYGLGYDPANANPRGRMVSLTVGKLW